MPDHPLVKIFKLLGWSWLGEELGVPISETAVNFTQAIHQERGQLIQENLDLQQKLLQLWADKQELQMQLSRKGEDVFLLQKENERLRRRIEELERQAAAQLQPLPVARKKTRLESSTSRWLEVMPDSARGLILGAPGAGKSASGHLLLELQRWRITPYILGFPKAKAHLLPQWIGLAESFDRVPQGSVILVDEAYLLYHARKSGFDKTAQEMSRALGLARQRGHSLLFVAHEGRHLDKNVIGYTNFLVIKEPGAMNLKFERPELKEVLERAKGYFLKVEASERKQYSYVWSPEADFEGPLPTPLPSYWTDEISRAYAGGISSPGEKPPSTSKEEKKQQAKALREVGLSYGKIAERLAVSKATIINWLKHSG